jgi:hypothetical protein
VVAGHMFLSIGRRTVGEASISPNVPFGAKNEPARAGGRGVGEAASDER